MVKHQFLKMKGSKKKKIGKRSEGRMFFFSIPLFLFRIMKKKKPYDRSVRSITHRWGCVFDKKRGWSVLVRCEEVQRPPQWQCNRQLCVTHDMLCASVCIIIPKQSSTNNNCYVVWRRAHTFHTRQAEGDKILPTTNKFTFLMMFILLPTV